MVKYKDPDLDYLFKALSDSTRRNIIEQLSERKLMITEIASKYDMSLPAVSKHIKVLEKAGIIKRDKDGKMHEMSLNKEAMETAWIWIEKYRKFWESSFDSLEKFLDKKKNKQRRLKNDE